MNIIFIDTRFPGQFRLPAEISGKDKGNKIVFITSPNSKDDRGIPGVEKLIFSDTPPKGLKDAPWPAQAVADVLAGLKKSNYVPDLIIGHSGSGTLLYVKDVFQDTPFLGFFEWYHSPDHIQDKFNTATGPDLRLRMDLRNRNLPVLGDLCACDHGLCPTAWQKTQFPKEFHEKLSVVHPGIDTHSFQPLKDQGFKTDTLDLSGVGQLITYTANTLVPFWGFRQFMEALPAVLEQKPEAHIVIVGSDRFSTEDPATGEKAYKSVIFEKIRLDPGRVHFIDALTYEAYKKLLQASAVHIYLDSPLMLSTTLLEAMSCGCLVIAPDTPPVREVITDGSNGIIADFSIPDKISQKILACLDYPSFMKAVKQKARQTVVERYAIEKTLPQTLDIIKKMAGGKHLKQFG
jgi:glycosyltransferase involved in cell wall biosynthesis